MVKWCIGGLYEYAEARGGVPEWLKGADCKSVGVAYVGSNPTSPTKFHFLDLTPKSSLLAGCFQIFTR